MLKETRVCKECTDIFNPAEQRSSRVRICDTCMEERRQNKSIDQEDRREQHKQLGAY